MKSKLSQPEAHKKQPVVIDCDPGHDDAVALIMALATPDLDVKLVTTSAGNQSPEKTYRNARNILALAGRSDIPVHQGASKPIRRDLIIADFVHGETGLDGAELRDSTRAHDRATALEALREVLVTSPEPVTIVATGPLTNIAILVLAHPEILHKIKQISFMGGACFGGNYTPAAEFNIYVDPEAADIVMQSGVPLAMFGLDVTHKAALLPVDIDRLEEVGTEVAKTLTQLLRFYSRTATQDFLVPKDQPIPLHMHDPCAVAYLIDPSLFTMVDAHVEVSLSEGITLGQTVVDYNQTTGQPAQVKVGFDIDRERFVQLLIQCVKDIGPIYPTGETHD